MNTLILDGLFVYKDLEKNFNNKTSLEIIVDYAKKNKFSRFILLNNGKIKNIPDGVKNILLDNIYPKNILSAILKEAKDTDNIVVFNAGNPFYDVDFIEKMIERHDKYLADFTYCIGYPEGLTPSIIKKNILKELIELVKDIEQIKKNYLFFSISKDINSFDIETFIAEIDLRIHRISFGLSDKGEEKLTIDIFKILKENFTVDSIIKYYKNNLDKLFTTIYSVFIELSNYSRISSIYYPSIQEEKKLIDFNILKKIVKDLKNMNEKIHIILSGQGEPLEHKEFLDIINFLLKEELEVIVETTGYGIDNNLLEKIDNNYKKNLYFVIKIDAYCEKTYKIIHKEGNFNEINDKINLIKKYDFKIYKQIVRMQENEYEIEQFIRNKQTEELIIRKYTNYCGILPDKKVVDLSPFERIPCFHLRRELYINTDLTVSTCMYSRYKKNSIIGDLKKQNVNEVIEKVKQLYIDNVKSNYINFCMNCDDYYLFNF